MAPTLLVASTAADASDHTITIPAATAGRAVVAVMGVAATIVLHADSVAAGWVQDSYAVNNMGSGAYRLDGADNPGGSLSLRVTHNGPRALAYVVFEDDIVSLVDATTPSESSTITTSAADLLAADLVIAAFPMTCTVNNSGGDITGYSTSFTELGDSGYRSSADEDARCWVAYRENVDINGAVTGTESGFGGSFTCAGFYLAYEVEAAPAEPVSGDGAGTFPQLVGAGTAEEVFDGAGAGVLPLVTGSGSGTVRQDVTGNGAGALPAVTGAGTGTGAPVTAEAPAVTNWESLRGVLASARADAEAERDAPPAACWFDGEPLLQARGVLHCRFCGRTY